MLKIFKGQKFNIAVLRHPALPENAYDLLEANLSDLTKTVYKRKAPLEEAPQKTDCLTSIHYLFLKALNIKIPLTFVGNMPRSLVNSGWTFHIIDTAEMKTGDLFFLKRRAESRLIIHAALVMNMDKIFHCKRDVGVVIEPMESLLKVYEQKILKEQLMYIDTRSKKERKLHKGCYLKKPDEDIPKQPEESGF